MQKTNKSYSKRLKVTKNGKVLARKPGQNHFNAKESRRSQITNKRGMNKASAVIAKQAVKKFLPHK